jgi:dCTP deaminase
LSVGRQLPSVLANVSEHDRIRVRGGRNSIPAVLRIDTDLAWLLGLYVAEGYRRRGQVVISNTQSEILDRAQYAFGRLGLKVSRREGVAITCSSVAFSALIAALGIGDGAAHKRLPVGALGWPRTLLSALFDGLLAGDGRREATRDTYWTCSTALAGEILLLAERLGRRAAVSWRPRGRSGLFEIGMPKDEHTLLTGVPLPDELLVELRRATGVTQAQLAAVAGYRRASDLNNIERRSARDAVRLETLRRLRGALAPAGSSDHQPKLDRLVDGHLRWDRVEEVRDTGEWAPIFDLEVRPDGRHVENFLAGWGGVFVSNTAGFVDAGWDGQLTLELSNVANLPITLYPGMKIGQISFLRMTTAAEHPYGSGEVGSKYQGQVGPRPSRYYENFRDTR